MSALRLKLSFEEGQTLRELVFGISPERETRLLALLHNGRVLQALRTDTGPILALPPELRVAGPAELRALDVAKGIDRVVVVELGRVGSDSALRIWESLLDGSLRADPPWLPVLERVRAWPVLVREGLRRFLEDGVYGLVLEGDAEREPSFVCAHARAGQVLELIGIDALGRDASSASAASLLLTLERRVGRTRLLIEGSRAALAGVLASPHPASALEHASIRGQLRIVRVSPLIRAGLFMARLLGL